MTALPAHVGRLLVAGMLALSGSAAHAVMTVTDDAGRTLSLERPAQRIISLAPHVTELLFAAGAGPSVVGVSAHSDYPADARQRPQVGDSRKLDLERILRLKPDLVIAWKSGNHPRQIAQLRAHGVPVFESEPRNFQMIETSLRQFGQLAGTREGERAAERFAQSLAQLRQRYHGAAPLTAFYQIWPSPLMTLNGDHLVTEALALCGIKNVFAHLPQLSPMVTREAVIAADPDLLIFADEQDAPQTQWRRLQRMKAVRNGHLLIVDGTRLNRAGPRILEATEYLCAQAQQRRKQHALQP